MTKAQKTTKRLQISHNKRKLSLKMKSKSALYQLILSSIACLFLAHLEPGRAQTQTPQSQTKSAFRDGLIEGCSKNRSKKTCNCYGEAVVSRYNDVQLTAIYIQMKKDPESRKMFYLSHSPEMIKCMK